MQLNLGWSEGVIVKGHVGHGRVSAVIGAVAALAENLRLASHICVAVEAVRNKVRGRHRRAGASSHTVDVKLDNVPIIGNDQMIPRPRRQWMAKVAASVAGR